MSFVSTDDAAQQLGITPRRVVQLLNQRALEGRRVQRDWLVSASSVRQRQALSSSRGRPMAAHTARSLVDALDENTALPLDEPNSCAPVKRNCSPALLPIRSSSTPSRRATRSLPPRAYTSRANRHSIDSPPFPEKHSSERRAKFTDTCRTHRSKISSTTPCWCEAMRERSTSIGSAMTSSRGPRPPQR